ncbi:hypothetical protein RHMOL_Rhmol04G0329700 [Rhododendron molle]|uniref:Uncharacterized protein n=1 Tax=Rhododendron molle TaxID=49168 RepID=A0ACC0P6T5_RHOML|nr:hypothetical protein RHMOL_Rhmol04G0329700 [Rhododendron molle]
MDEIEQRIESRLTECFTTHLSSYNLRCLSTWSPGAQRLDSLTRLCRFPDAASGHRTVRESIGDYTTPLEQGHRTQARSPGLVEQFGRELYLQTPCIPKCDVGEGLFITSDPGVQIDTEQLGEDYCNVYVGESIMPHVLLERPRRGVEMVGDALSHYVLWNLCDVIEKEGDD